MKNLFAVLTAIFLVTNSNAQNSNAEALARRFSEKIKDSLHLTDNQARRIYETNLYLHEQKLQVRRQINDTASLGVKIQRVESMRDSLYKNILDPKQYMLYKNQKRLLISNN